jgi:hypothetical protein
MCIIDKMMYLYRDVDKDGNVILFLNELAINNG